MTWKCQWYTDIIYKPYFSFMRSLQETQCKREKYKNLENCAIPMFWILLKSNPYYAQGSQIKLPSFFLCPEHGHGHLPPSSQAWAEGLDKMTSRGSLQALGLSKGESIFPDTPWKSPVRALPWHQGYWSSQQWALHVSRNVSELPKGTPVTSGALQGLYWEQ